MHVIFDRTRRGFPAQLFFPFELGIGLDLVDAENIDWVRVSGL
jgi:hypothetical protein